MTACERPAPAPTGTGLPTNRIAAKPPVRAAQDSGNRGQKQPSNTWARRLIAAGGTEIPLYGSPEWHALPADHPARVAACVRAAEAWDRYWQPEEIARRLQAEIDAARQDAIDEAEQWLRKRVEGAGRPRYSQLADRRGQHERAARARQIERAIGLEVA